MFAAAIPHIVEQHAEEAAFLWFLRNRAVNAPHYKLSELTRLDNRVEAHLDGLRIAGPEGWNLCEQALEIGEAGEVFTAGLLALESKNPQKLAKVASIAEDSVEAAKGLVSAFGWTEPSKLARTVKLLLDSSSSFHRFIGLSACAVHRVNPGNILDNWVQDHDAPSLLRARALRTVGELKRRDLIYDLRNCFHAQDAAIRFWAAWSAVLLGNRSDALEVLKVFMATGSRQFPGALPMLLRAMPIEGSAPLLKGLAQYPERQRDLIAGTGMVGDPLYVPWLIKQMETPELARLAGESFSFITGADIAYENLEGERPEGFESGPTETPEDEDVELDGDEDLPWPDPAKIQAWWVARQHRFQAGSRYLLGAPISESQCRKVLQEGFQHQRTAAALELALMRPDEPLFEVRAPGWRQQRLFLHTA
ncbi:TIGR02270 family protein [Methylobacter sp. Wu1]|uniref:TIGR02270 family protein n=1 Tax=Methylobacter sp. Wu1 TaxID=3119359 RepID=UPI002F9297B6